MIKNIGQYFQHFSILTSLVVGFSTAAYGNDDAYRVDRKFKAAGHIINDHTRDACDSSQLVKVEARDGVVGLKPGETRFFANAHPDKKWRWWCGGSGEKARIEGARYVMAVRKANGVIDWYSVNIDL